MGPKCCKTKHMANLDGTPSDPGWDLDGPRIDPGEGLDGTPRDSNRLLGLSERQLPTLLTVFAIRANRSNAMKVGFFLRMDLHELPRFALRIAGPS